MSTALAIDLEKLTVLGLIKLGKKYEVDAHDSYAGMCGVVRALQTRNWQREYRTFSAFLQAAFAWGKTYADDWIASVSDDLSTIVDNPGQARELRGLDKATQIEVAETAKAKAQGPVTAKTIRETRRELLGQRQGFVDSNRQAVAAIDSAAARLKVLRILDRAAKDGRKIDGLSERFFELLEAAMAEIQRATVVH